MTSTPPPSPSSPESSSSVLSDADLERLDELLSEPPYAERALPLDAMQGVFYALAMGPDEVPESTWMPAVLGADPDGEPEEIPAEVEDLLRRFLAETANDADHPLRKRVTEILAKFAEELKNDPVMHARISAKAPTSTAPSARRARRSTTAAGLTTRHRRTCSWGCRPAQPAPRRRWCRSAP